MDKLNGILTNINAALDKFQVGSGPLAGKSIASATQGLNFMEVGGREGGREGGGAWNYRVPRRMGDGGWGLQAEPCGLGMRVCAHAYHTCLYCEEGSLYRLVPDQIT